MSCIDTVDEGYKESLRLTSITVRREVKNWRELWPN